MQNFSESQREVFRTGSREELKLPLLSKDLLKVYMEQRETNNNFVSPDKMARDIEALAKEWGITVSEPKALDISNFSQHNKNGGNKK